MNHVIFLLLAISFVVHILTIITVFNLSKIVIAHLQMHINRLEKSIEKSDAIIAKLNKELGGEG